MSAYGALKTIDGLFTELLRELEKRRADRWELMKLIDEIESEITYMMHIMSPEKITDERFKAINRALDDLDRAMMELRKAILEGRYHQAREKALEAKQKIIRVQRMLVFIRAGAPTPMIVQVAPEYFKTLTPPDAVRYLHPMAERIWNIVVRRGRVSIDELINELREQGIDVRDPVVRDDVNKALNRLIETGYIRTEIDERGRHWFVAVR